MNKLFDKIHNNLINGERMSEAEIKALFGIPQQTLYNWKKGKSGEGKKKLYTLLSLIDAETVEHVLNLNEKIKSDSDKKNQPSE